MSERAEIMKGLDHLAQEVAALKKTALRLRPVSSLRTKRAWRNLVETSKKKAKSWDNISAVEEVRDQREKKW